MPVVVRSVGGWVPAEITHLRAGTHPAAVEGVARNAERVFAIVDRVEFEAFRANVLLGGLIEGTRVTERYTMARRAAVISDS